MKNIFKNQIDYFPELTESALEKVEFKTVWSGKRLQVGDKVLYAYVYIPNTDDLKAITFIERELNELPSKFKFLKFENEDNMIPILSFNTDKKR